MIMKKMTFSCTGLILLCMFFGNAMYGQGLADRLNLTPEKFLRDQSKIVEYINYVSWRIRNLGLNTPPKIAKAFRGIEQDVYDSMPEIFVNEMYDDEKIKIAFSGINFDENSIRYIKEEIEVFEREKEKPVHSNLVGRISYRKLVDNLHISDEDKKVLKKEPKKMKYFIEKKIVNKEEYMHFNLLNLTAQYYLQQSNIINL